MTTFDCSDPVARRAGIEAAAHAAGSGSLVVMPTDTVYGIGADAFNAAAVRALLAAKGRGPDIAGARARRLVDHDRRARADRADRRAPADRGLLAGGCPWSSSMRRRWRGTWATPGGR